MRDFDEEKFHEWFWNKYDLEDCVRNTAIVDLVLLIRKYDASDTDKSCEDFLMEDFMESKHPAMRVDEEDEYARVWNF